MELRGSTILPFDIETTGLSGIEDTLLCAVALAGGRVSVFEGIEDLLEWAPDGVSGILLTYNGDHWRGGFDMPFLRSLCIRNGMDWPFAGCMHLDLYPLVETYISTSLYTEKIPARSKLRKHDLKKLAFANDIEYSTVGDTYQRIRALHEERRANWLDYSEVTVKETNSLQEVYQMFFDPEGKEEYVESERMPELYEQGDIEAVIEHCRRDVVRLEKVAEAVLPYIPECELDKGIRKL